MEAEEQSCCGCCCKLIFTSGFTALFLWLSLRVNSPTCSIENFTVFALNKTANSSITPNNNNNHTIRYDLKLNNKDNKDKGIYYDTLNLTFYYKLNQTSVSIGNATFKDFYQGHGKKTHRIATIDGGKGVKWENDTATTASFSVVLNTSVRYKILFWKTKRHRLDLSAALLVDETGSLIKRKKKGIKFTSKAWNSRGCNFLALGILGFLSFILFW